MVGERSEKKKTIGKIVIVVLLLGIIFLGAFFIYRAISPFRGALKVEKVDVSFAIGEFGGFNVNKTALTYGTITPGGSSVRNVILGNSYSFPIIVKVFASKSLTQFLTVEENLSIEHGESKKVGVTIQAPGDAEFGNYSGEISFVFLKSENR
ncbi:MAG: hypothetical protein AABW75_03855 [Nanoarchaeota archaeon]